MDTIGVSSTRFVAIVATIAVTTLSGCSNFELKQPVEVISPSATTLTVVGNPSLSNLAVTVDGTNVSNQLNLSGSNTATGTISLPIGVHTVTAGADVPCWYCSGQKYHPTDTKTACVVNPAPAVPGIKIPAAVQDSKSWADSGGTLSVAADTGTSATKWVFVNLAGAFNTIGVIQSVAEFPCTCLQSMDDTTGSALGLATCNFSDTRQRWDGRRQQTANNKGQYSFEIQTASHLCLAESGTTLVQTNCANSGDRLWTLFNVALSRFESDINAFSQ